jgi:hypothetical protein
MPYIVAASTAGAVALVAGILAIVTANEAMLATLTVASALLWLMATVRHAITGAPSGRDRTLMEGGAA